MIRPPFPSRVQIIEVGPRDGLQNEKRVVPLEAKVEFIRLLAASGLPEIEAGAFVSPKWVPQMADSAEVFERLRRLPESGRTVYSALVPNEKGMAAALKAGARKVAVFTAASETFNRKNINCSIAESIERFRPVLDMARAEGVAVRGYVSTAFVCPYEGGIAPEKVADVSRRLIDLGIKDVSIGDTIGKATPDMVRALLECLISRNSISDEFLSMHFHDTYGNALANIEASLAFYVKRYDASVAGLGGCPYAPGASGNVSTNVVTARLRELGVETGVDQAKLDAAAAYIRGVLG